jgi:hypothetical protein
MISVCSKLNDMARIGNYPTTYEQRKSVSITDLRKWKYLQSDTWRSGTINWRRNGEITSQIDISVDMIAAEPYIKLNYGWQGQSIVYNVSFIQAPSNLGAGNVWYFLCPFTGKRCRKLYFIDGYFKHRGKGYYDKQIQSKNYRYLEKVYGPMFKADELYNQLYSPHFRKYYNGKPTKRYAKILTGLKAADSVNETDFINAMVRK